MRPWLWVSHRARHCVPRAMWPRIWGSCGARPQVPRPRESVGLRVLGSCRVRPRGTMWPRIWGSCGAGHKSLGPGEPWCRSPLMSVTRPRSEWVFELVTRVLGHGRVPPTSCLTVPWGEHKYLFLEADANHWANRRRLAPARLLHKGCGGTRAGIGGLLPAGPPKSWWGEGWCRREWGC